MQPPQAEIVSPSMCEALAALIGPADDARVMQALKVLFPEWRGVRCRQAQETREPGGERLTSGGVEVYVPDAEAARPRWGLVLALTKSGEAADLFTLAEAVGPVVHQLNNHLQAIVMQAAILQYQAAEPLRERAAAIRREGAAAGKRLRMLQAVRPWSGDEDERNDLAEALGDAGGAEVIIEGTAVVPGPAMALRRMGILMAKISASFTGGPGRLRVGGGEEPCLEADLPGAKVETNERGEPDLPVAEDGLKEVEREAARGLIRRAHGKCEIVATETGAVMRAVWRKA